MEINKLNKNQVKYNEELICYKQNFDKSDYQRTIKSKITSDQSVMEKKIVTDQIVVVNQVKSLF